jgi:hypothetical protein
MKSIITATSTILLVCSIMTVVAEPAERLEEIEKLRTYR